MRESHQPSDNKIVVDAKESFTALLEIATILNTGLNAQTLTHCVRLCEAGVHPNVLADVIKEIRQEVANKKQQTVNKS